MTKQLWSLSSKILTMRFTIDRRCLSRLSPSRDNRLIFATHVFQYDWTSGQVCAVILQLMMSRLRMRWTAETCKTCSLWLWVVHVNDKQTDRLVVMVSRGENSTGRETKRQTEREREREREREKERRESRRCRRKHLLLDYCLTSRASRFITCQVVCHWNWSR